MQIGVLGKKGSTLHEASFGHLRLLGQDFASDKTKDIKMYVVISKHDVFHIQLEMPANIKKLVFI